MNKFSLTHLLWALGFTASLVAAPLTMAGTVTVVTSFPKELTAAYKQAFEKKYPDTKLEILNKSTTQGMAYVRELPVGQRPDVFWASAPDAFEVLARDKLLDKITDLANPKIPAKIGNYPMNDPEGMYLGQALGGYGIMWNTRYLAANKLKAPKEWAELTAPAYFGHLAISAPSRSGTTHLTIETILQGEGWEKGWRQVLQIAGNCAQITERSFGVPDGVNNGQFGIGLVVDFFGLAGKYSGFPVDFVYPTVTAVVPANIALVAGAKNAADGKKFISFALSNDGQELLLDAKISRLPAMPLSSLTTKVAADYPNAFEIAKRAKVQFDSNLSEARYNIVSSLFDQAITFRIKELQAATKAIHEADAKLAAKPNKEGAALLKQAQDLTWLPLVTEANLKDKAFVELFTKSKKEAAVNKQVSSFESEWNDKAKKNYEQARDLAMKAAALAK